jgi:hypothetical protein
MAGSGKRVVQNRGFASKERTSGLMSPAPLRRLTLLDAMILIAATAIGAQSIHVIWSLLNVSHLASPLDNRPFLGVLVRAPHAISAAVPLIAAWTVALPALWICQPCPPFHRLVLQPGMAACTAATLALAISALYRIAEVAAHAVSLGQPLSFGDRGIWASISLDLIQRPSGVGIAVAAVWSWMILGRRWRPQPTWIDRLGRALGVYWLMMIFWILLLESLMLSRVVTIA